MAFVNLDRSNGMAMTLVRKRVELAIAAIFAIAVDKFPPLEFPISHR
jgi:hypothetical protein